MVFSSILFLCGFLPVAVAAYYAAPRRFRNAFLLLASLVFYGWGEPRYILIMLFSTAFDYANGRLLERFDARPGLRKAVLANSIAVNLGVLCFFKYTDFAIENVNRLTGTGFGLLQLALPIGISFYTFQTLSYTIDVYRRRVAAQRNLVDFAMFVCMFPQLVAGPIVRYAEIESQLRGRVESAGLFWEGLVRFAAGLGKKVLLANQAGALWAEVSSISPTGELPALTAWVGLLAFTFQIYFDFSGYSDMAIGLGKMFGFRLPENFRYPYESRSVTEFWRRWHMTLGAWFRDYLYFPLGGSRCGRRRLVFNLLVVWALTGLWHGAGWNFVVWGLFYFVLLTVEKLFLLRRMKSWPTALRHLYTLAFVMLGWALFACDDAALLAGFAGSLFGLHGGASSMSLYYLATYGLTFAIMAVASTRLPHRAAEALLCRLAARGGSGTTAVGAGGEDGATAAGAGACGWRGWAAFALEALFVVAMVGLSLAFLAGDSYNPFLYFRF